MTESYATLSQESLAESPRIYVLLLRQDDPRKCSAAKLAKFRLATPLFRMRQIPRRTIVLNPFAPQVLLPADRAMAERNGIVSIDCSWEKVDKAFAIRMPGEPRRLPPLLASNPVNYAKVHKLSSAEAIAGALCIMGLSDRATRILSLFKWGPAFFTLNSQLLRSYSQAATEADVARISADFF